MCKLGALKNTPESRAYADPKAQSARRVAETQGKFQTARRPEKEFCAQIIIAAPRRKRERTFPCEKRILRPKIEGEIIPRHDSPVGIPRERDIPNLQFRQKMP